MQNQNELVHNMMIAGDILSRRLENCNDPLLKELVITYKTYSGLEETLRLCLHVLNSSEIEERIKLCSNLNLDYCYIPDSSWMLNTTRHAITSISAKFAVFEDNSIFYNITPFEGFDFTGAMFLKTVTFKNATIMKTEANFDFVQFESDVYYLNCKIESSIDFYHAKIIGAVFTNCIFNSSVMFDLASADTISFFRCDFLGEGSSRLSLFSCVAINVYFQYCNIISDQQYDLRTVKRYEFSNSILERNIEFVQIDGKTIPGMLSFDEKTSCTGRIKSDWATIKEAIDLHIYEPRKTKTIEDADGVTIESDASVKLRTYTSKCHTLIVFKENYRSLGNYDWEDEAYVEFKRNERKKMKYAASLDKKHCYKLKVKIFLSSLIDIVGCYGTNPTRVALSMFVIFMLFSGLFTLCFFPDIRAGVSDIHWWTGFYFSGITFLTIGYGVVTPLGVVSSALAVIEGFIGMFLMSYFSVAVVRKTLR